MNDPVIRTTDFIVNILRWGEPIIFGDDVEREPGDILQCEEFTLSITKQLSFEEALQLWTEAGRPVQFLEGHRDQTMYLAVSD